MKIGNKRIFRTRNQCVRSRKFSYVLSFCRLICMRCVRVMSRVEGKCFESKRNDVNCCCLFLPLFCIVGCSIFGFFYLPVHLFGDQHFFLLQFIIVYYKMSFETKTISRILGYTVFFFWKKHYVFPMIAQCTEHNVILDIFVCLDSSKRIMNIRKFT